MGFFLEYDQSNNTVRLTFEGSITPDDIGGGAYNTLRSFVASRPPCKGIADFSNVKVVEVASRMIQDRARLPPVLGGQLFVIVAPEDHLFGLSRMFSLHAERTRPHIHVVRRMDEAYRLLGIETPEFKPVSDCFRTRSCSAEGKVRNCRKGFCGW